jgi:pilus assembly protein CpaC
VVDKNIIYKILILLNLLIAAPYALAEEPVAKDVNLESENRRFVTLTLGLDQDEKIPKDLKNFSFAGDYKKVASIENLSGLNTIRFFPKNEGIATLMLRDKKTKKVKYEFRLVVKKSRLDLVANEIRDLLADIEGIQIKVRNNKVMVDGQILLPKDMNRIYAVLQQYPDIAVSLVTVSPIAQKKIAEIIAREINNPEITVRSVNDRLYLEGFANSEDEKDKAEKVAKTFIPSLVLDKAEQDQVVRRVRPANDGIVNLIKVKPEPAAPPAKIVQLIIHYVELTKDYNKGFRFSWLPNLVEDQSSGLQFSTGTNNQTGGTGTSLTGVVNNLIPKLNWAKSHGHARILESLSLIVQDGKPGTIKSGGEVPFQTPAPSGNALVTSFKEVGISSKVTPIILGERSDTISMTVSFEVSALVGSTAAGPRTSKNFIETELSVRSGQSAAIGGLITNRANTGYNRLPAGAPTNPILSLYASKEFNRDQSQFVVFITPIIKSSASAGSEKIKQKFRLRD